MTTRGQQQIVISGVGGQGVLFVTRLLAEAAIARHLAVITSETHGMAQRGGTVLSHLKVGGFSSPLIRPGQADGLLVLNAENLELHGAYLRPGGWAVCNTGRDGKTGVTDNTAFLDADCTALDLGNPRAANLVLLGFALGRAAQPGGPQLFCGIADLRQAVAVRLEGRPDQFAAAMAAVEAGYRSAE